MIRVRPAPPSPPMVTSPIQSGCGCSYGFIPPCGVAVVVIMVSCTPCGVAVVVVMVSSIPCGVAVVVVMVSST